VLAKRVGLMRRLVSTSVTCQSVLVTWDVIMKVNALLQTTASAQAVVLWVKLSEFPALTKTTKANLLKVSSASVSDSLV